MHKPKISKQLLSLTVATTFLAPALAPLKVWSNQAIQANLNERKQIAALSESEKLALQMIIAASMAEQKGADLAQVDENVLRRYQTLRNVYFGSVPTSAVGTGLAVWIGPQALKTSAMFGGPLLRLIQPVLLTMWSGLKASGRGINAVLTALKFDVLLEKSSNGIESSYKNIIEPMIKLLVTKNTMILSASVGSTGALYTSYKFFTTDAKEAMSYEQLRNMLGQNEAIRSRIDSLVSGVAPVLNLDASAQAKLKVLIYDEILKQAIAANFSEDSSKYNLDLIALMADNNLISQDMLQAVAQIRKVAGAIKLSESTTKSAQEIIQQNVDVALSLATIIESNINSGRIQDQRTLAEMQRMLGALNAQLALIGFNLSK